MIRALRIVQLTTLLLLMQLPLHAQVYPVQVVPQLLPPYTLNISEYYQGAQEKLVVLLTNTDLTKPNLQVRLKMSIQGQNAKLKSRDGVYYPPITLDGGAPQRISLADLAPYFNIDNLEPEGITRSQYQQNQKLPEGFYQFCFEAYEYNTNRLVGRSNCAMAWISLLDPPLLNLPRKAESIAYKDPANIIFQWTPRNMGSPTAAFNTEYEFTLVEIWDSGIAPEAAFGTTQPLFRTTTQTTTLLYGPSEPLLIPGKRYAWRIRAQASDGSQRTDSYRNNGYSEIYWFTYQRDCPAPYNVQSEVSGGKATITWNAALQQTSFTVDYREKGQTASQWYTVNSSANRVTLYDLKKDKQYEYRAGAYCDAGNDASFAARGAVYSDIKSFSIDGSKVDADADATACNVLQPELKIANRSPIQTLMSGDVITAGDFPVKLITVQGQGNFTGTGYITIPFLGKLAVKVRFSNITVNTDKHLIGGVIETTYDKDSKQVIDANDITGDPASVAILKELKDNIPDPDTAPLDDLINFAEKLSEVSTGTIDNALALTPAEKTQLKQNIAAMDEAREVLEDKNATPQQKAEAEQKLRQAVKEAAPIVQKLGETVGKGVQSIVSKWFNNVRDFLKGYSGSESDKKQAAQWHTTTDSLVAVLMQSKNVPDSMLASLDKATRAAAPAWIALENGAGCNGADNAHPPKGPYFDDVINDYSCYVALGNKQYDVIDKVYETAQNNLFDGGEDLVFEEVSIKESPADVIVFTPDAKKYRVKGGLSKFIVDVNGALSSFTWNGVKYNAVYSYNTKTKEYLGFAGFANPDSVKRLKVEGFFNFATAKANPGYTFDPGKHWELLSENADKVEMMKCHFERNGKLLKNNSPEIRDEILKLMQQLPDAVFRIVKDPDYIQFYDQVALRDHLKQQLNSVESAMQRIQALIDAYQEAKDDKTPMGVRKIIKARCNITKELEKWSVAKVKSSADRPEFGYFEKLSQKQRLDLLQIMYELPMLTTSVRDTSGTNCYLANFGEETVIALLKYAPDQDKAAIIGYFKSDSKILPHFYEKIDNKNFMPDDHNFDQFIRELIIANAVWLKATNAKPNDNAPTIKWKAPGGKDVFKSISFNNEGKVLINYVTYELNATNLIFPIVCGPLGIWKGISSDQSTPVDPLEIVNLVIPEPDEKYWPDFKDATKFPYTIQVPAISAAWMINKTTNDRIQMGIDLAMIALSAGEYAVAKGTLQYIWVTAQIAIPAANTLMQTEPGLVYKLWGAYDSTLSYAEKAERRSKADAFMENYNTFSTLVDIGAMGEGMYSLYKELRGSAREMKSMGIIDQSGIMSTVEKDLEKIDDIMPGHLKLGELTTIASARLSMIEKLKSKGLKDLLEKFKALEGSQREIHFIDDFTNASDDVLNALNKQNSVLLNSWMKFRNKYPNEILCN